jgi:class 3 adenylate cyclase
MDLPEIEYARSGDVSIAYQVIGKGPTDLVFVPFIGNLASWWELPGWVRFFERCASFSRLIVFDKRRTGLSDRPGDLPTLEVRMDDVRAVLDAIGSESAALFGTLEGCQMSALFAATYPERARALVLFHPAARMVTTPDYPWGFSVEEWHSRLRAIRAHWGERAFLERLAKELNPGLADDQEYLRWIVNHSRLAASPSAAYAFYRMQMETDIRHVLPAIRVPTLVLHRRLREREARYFAERIPGSRSIALGGTGDGIYEDNAQVVDEIESFLNGLREEQEPDRVLATVLFTDIVGSTERAATVGDRAWRELLERHQELVRGNLLRFRGREIDTTGDGFLASFDGPARGIRCACAIVEETRNLGFEVRAGLHAGECEILHGDMAGIAVHTGARIASKAEPSEVLVSSTVKDLVAGSGIDFEDRGIHELKGVPGEWRLYAVSDG